MKYIIPLVSVFAFSSPLSAADTEGRFAVRGLGAGKCSDLSAVIEKKDADRLADYADWFSGYVSALNRLVGKTFDAIPSARPNDVIGIVGVLCARNQDQLIETVAYKAVETLNEIRVREYSPAVTAQSQGKSLAIREETLSFVQESLKSARLYKGDVNGKWNEEISKAISQYQKTQQLPQTGLPDIDVIIRLKFK